MVATGSTSASRSVVPGEQDALEALDKVFAKLRETLVSENPGVEYFTVDLRVYRRRRSRVHANQCPDTPRKSGCFEIGNRRRRCAERVSAGSLRPPLA